MSLSVSKSEQIICCDVAIHLKKVIFQSLTNVVFISAGMLPFADHSFL